MHKLFKSLGLKIDLVPEQQQVDFLDVTFNITSNKFWPFRKPNSEILYINKNSNHPNNIKKELPVMVNKRLIDISCDIEEFDKVKKDYEEALRKSGFKNKLIYKNVQKAKRKRKRKIIWFNPPFDSNVHTNIGKKFLNLIDKHFPKEHKYHKIFNRNTIKISYSCLPNMNTIITAHNKKILHENNQQENNIERKCNCRKKEECPLKGNCLVESVIYKATLKTEKENFEYIGATEKAFKTRFYNHKKTFTNEKYKNETKLSTCIWELKDNNITYELEWDILKKCKPYVCGSRRCDICLQEKLFIMQYNRTNTCLLNTRSEIMNKCRHSNKYKIWNFK